MSKAMSTVSRDRDGAYGIRTRASRARVGRMSEIGLRPPRVVFGDADFRQGAILLAQCRGNSVHLLRGEASQEHRGVTSSLGEIFGAQRSVNSKQRQMYFFIEWIRSQRLEVGAFGLAHVLSPQIDASQVDIRRWRSGVNGEKALQNLLGLFQTAKLKQGKSILIGDGFVLVAHQSSCLGEFLHRRTGASPLSHQLTQ